MNESANAPRVARRAAAKGVALASALALGVVAMIAQAPRWRPARELLLARGTGWVALGALLLSLCATPLGRLVSRIPSGTALSAHVPVMRRALGMGAAWLALLHASVSWAGTLQRLVLPVWTWPHLRAGFCALLVLLLLLVASFGSAIQRLRIKLWKELHALAYVAALLVAQHTLLAPYAPPGVVLSLFCAALVFRVARCG